MPSLGWRHTVIYCYLQEEDLVFYNAFPALCAQRFREELETILVSLNESRRVCSTLIGSKHYYGNEGFYGNLEGDVYGDERETGNGVLLALFHNMASNISF